MTGRVPWVLSVAALTTVLPIPETRWKKGTGVSKDRPGAGALDLQPQELLGCPREPHTISPQGGTCPLPHIQPPR